METYLEIIINAYKGYANYLWQDIINPSFDSYFYWLIIVSFFFFLLEIVVPWRKKQSITRKDFYLDLFYMFFNFFLFSLIIYNAASDLVVHLFNDGIKWITNGFDLQQVNPLKDLPMWSILVIGFVVRDFVQWWTHRLLHKSPFLWEFHKVHHSVEEMGFAAHLRFHWMETVVYRTIEYIPLALMGVGLYDFFIIHIFTLSWGHYNHSNISIDHRITGGILGLLIGILITQNLWELNIMPNANLIAQLAVVLSLILFFAFVIGPIMKYLFNSPEMHIWHHSYELPEDRMTGVNFGLTLAIWDYIFGTAHVPHNGRDIRLGFPGVESFPEGFFKQSTNGIISHSKK